MREEEPSDLSQDLHNSDGGALAEDESSTEQGHCSPNCEDDSGEDKVRCSTWSKSCKNSCERSGEVSDVWVMRVNTPAKCERSNLLNPTKKSALWFPNWSNVTAHGSWCDEKQFHIFAISMQICKSHLNILSVQRKMSLDGYIKHFWKKTILQSIKLHINNDAGVKVTLIFYFNGPLAEIKLDI